MPTWTRVDTTYAVQAWGVDRGRGSELETAGPGSGWFELVDKTGAFDPTSSPAVRPLNHAAICLYNPVAAGWSTVLRGYVSRVRWTPYVTEQFANVRVEIVDALGVLSKAEMVPDGNWGNAVVGGNIVFDEDTATTAVQSRIGLVLNQLGWPANSGASDGVANGTTTFTSATASFATGDVGKFITIQTKGRYMIVALVCMRLARPL